VPTKIVLKNLEKSYHQPPWPGKYRPGFLGSFNPWSALALFEGLHGGRLETWKEGQRALSPRALTKEKQQTMEG
jgi:hypothetical protein